jgi:acetyl-CoA C-acetyltransferase
MRFSDVVVPAQAAWSSPFVRWQGPAAEISSLDLAEQVTRDGLARGGVEWPVEQLVLGFTVPQRQSFYGAPTLAARLGLGAVSGPMVMQACATSVAALHIGACSAGDGPQLVVTTDRTSNAPLLVYPGGRRPGGSPETEEWQLDNFACDPVTSESMLATAERVAAQASFDKGELDELAARRYEQYLDALSGERAFQRAWMVPIRAGTRRNPSLIEEDWGVRPVELDALRGLAPVTDGGVLSYGTQTHPADGSAGVVLTTAAGAATAGVEILARVLATGFARVAPGEMPKATVPAARRALADAGVDVGQVDVIKTHNPFAVNDLWLARELGVDAWEINPFGSSLVYGHPQGPTGMRGIVELIHALRARGGGLGLFTGCAAGDTGAAVVVRVDG